MYAPVCVYLRTFFKTKCLGETAILLWCEVEYRGNLLAAIFELSVCRRTMGIFFTLKGQLSRVGQNILDGELYNFVVFILSPIAHGHLNGTVFLRYTKAS